MSELDRIIDLANHVDMAEWDNLHPWNLDASFSMRDYLKAVNPREIYLLANGYDDMESEINELSSELEDAQDEVRSLEREVEDLRNDEDARRDMIDELLRLHQNVYATGRCEECGQDWPCTTYNVIEG